MTTSDAMLEVPTSGAEWVRQVYAAFGSTGPDAIEKTVRRHVADGCVVHEAESLPWGWAVRRSRGRRR
ncbi:hypothetical protein HNR02_005232 [Amycolatopsis endophytica]|uniref:Uncharacterized protein n=1 Tax=Amycolatopsis endophytica TaxID=860233 RepID=A0A853BAZ4_9PSEU|nr:hypothetical protein [Amycolatopsis endophytica]